MSYCKRDRCGAIATGRDRLCTEHRADREERRRLGALIPKCAHPGCNNQSNRESNLCTVHLRELEEERDRLEVEVQRQQAMDDFKDRLRKRITDATDFEALKVVLADCVDYWMPT